MDYQVFISAAADCPYCKPLFEKLLLLGYRATYGCCDITDSTAAYAQKLTGCKDVIFLLSYGALTRADYSGDLFSYSCKLAVEQGANILVLITDGLKELLSLPDSLAPLGGYAHPLDDGPLCAGNLNRSLDKICSLLSSQPIADIPYERECRELIKLRTPLINPYSAAASYNPVLLKFSAYVERMMLDSAELSFGDPREFRQFFVNGNDTYRNWYRQYGQLLEETHTRAAMLKSYVAESGTVDPYYYTAAVFFTGGQLWNMPDHFTVTFPLACMSTCCYALDWPEAEQAGLVKMFTKECHSIFQRVIPMPFAVFRDLLAAPGQSPERRKLVEKYTMMLFDYMMHLSALLLVTVKDPMYRAGVNQQMVAYYAYLKKLGLYLPSQMQAFMETYFK